MNIEEGFGGPGGWKVALRKLDLDQHATAYEWDRDSNETAVAAGFKSVQSDVRDVAGRYDTVLRIDSPPCQGFSLGGLRKGNTDAASGALRLGMRLLATGGSAWGTVERMVTAAAEGDTRVALVLWPLYWALNYRPENLCWEQVKTVLPLWEDCAEILREHGYDVITGILSAEQYDVAQVRPRAILIASRTHSVTLPKPTRRGYKKGIAQHEGDRALLPWLSMADVLPWESGLVGFPRKADHQASVELNGQLYRARDLVSTDRPSLTITEKARSWSRWISGQDQPVRVTLQEAAALQGMPEDYPFQGERTSKFLQVGNLIPPPLAWHILRATLGLPMEVWQ